MSQPEIIKSTPMNGVVRKAFAYHTLDFGRALCAHFGLEPGKVDSTMTMHTGQDEIFAVSIRISLTPDDLAGIAQHMAALQNG